MKIQRRAEGTCGLKERFVEVKKQLLDELKDLKIQHSLHCKSKKFCRYCKHFTEHHPPQDKGRNLYFKFGDTNPKQAYKTFKQYIKGDDCEVPDRDINSNLRPS